MSNWLPPPPQSPQERTASAGRWRRLGAGLAVAVVVGAVGLVIVGFAVVGPRLARIEGHAMSPTLLDDDRVVLRRVDASVGRGSVVMLRYPKNPAKRFIMRVVGLPGERVAIADGVVEIDGRRIDEPYVIPEHRSHEFFAPLQLGDDEYFVLGDNRRNASDSREWGPVPRRYVLARMGVVWYRAR